jgi:hypothetical protein
MEASGLGATPKPHCRDGHHERRTELEPGGHVEQQEKNDTSAHSEDGPSLGRARHDTTLPPPANVRTIKTMREQPLLERWPTLTRRPSGQDEEGDGRQYRDCDACDADGECNECTGTPKNVPRLSQHAGLADLKIWKLGALVTRHTLLLALSLGVTCAHADERFERPAVIRFGASIAEVERALEGQCTQRRLRTDDPVFLPNVRERQSQLDCKGFQFFGQGRHLEFVFRDGRLMMVWLIVTDAEASTMIDAMTRAYGAPTERNADYVTFERDRAAWRYRPAEILFWAEELDSDIACIYPAVSPGRCAQARD